jgi:hypothetical protein
VSARKAVAIVTVLMAAPMFAQTMNGIGNAVSGAGTMQESTLVA